MSSNSSNYRCIYCGDSIPPDIGLRCAKCAAPAKAKAGHQYGSTGDTTKDFDRELEYDTEISPEVARVMAETESRQVSQSSQQSKEEFCRLYEMNVEARKQYRWPNQEELQAKREGRILHMNEFLRLLKKALPAGFTTWYTEKGGMANTLGLYIGHPVGAAPLPSCTHAVGQPHYVGFVQVPYMQEFEELHFDRHHLPLGSKKRGWRTILLKLIESKILTEEQAHASFGAPLGSIISRRYNEYLQYTRNRSMSA